jgi:hypothetical protein
MIKIKKRKMNNAVLIHSLELVANRRKVQGEDVAAKGVVMLVCQSSRAQDAAPG